MTGRGLPFILAFIGLLVGCSHPEVLVKERQVFEAQVREHRSIKRQVIEHKGDRLHFASAGDPANPSLVMIHGTPSDWGQFARFMLNEALLEHFHVVVIDRPGWGASSLSNNRRIASFAEQSTLIGQLLIQLRQANQGKPIILLGHSLGASLAPRIAVDFPDKVDGLLLLAGTLDPALAKPRWFNHVARLWVVNAVLSDSMRKANEEIFALKENLLAIRAQLPSLGVQTIIVQGTSDQLVYPENADFAEQVFNPDYTEVIRLNKTGHLFPMTQRQRVIDWSLNLLARLED